MSEPSKDAEQVSDKDDLYRDFYDGMQRRYLKTVISDAVIEEHKQKPLGQHSEPLERLLMYFRRRPNEGKLVIKADSAKGPYRIAALSGVRGQPPRLVDERAYDTVEDAYHGIFLIQIDELMRA